MATLQENVAARKKARETKAAPIQTPIIQTPRSNVTREASYTPGTQNATVAPQVDPGYDSRGAGNPVYKTTEELTGAFTSQNTRKAELQKQLSSGQLSQDDYNREISQMFTQDQYDAALRNIESGYGGVDPLGFGNSNLAGVGPYKTLEEAEAAAEAERVKTGTVTPETQAAIYAFQNPTLFQGGNPGTPTDPAGRRPAGAALQDPRSGAGGRVGKLGINPIEEISKKEEEAIAEARRSNGAGYGGNVNTAEQAIRATYQAERQKEIDRMTSENKKIEFDNQQKEQENLNKQGAPTIDSFATQTLDDSIAQITALTNNSTGLQHDVFSAYLPSLTGILNRLKTVRMNADSIDTAAERSALAETQIAPEKALAAQRESQLQDRKLKDEALLKENSDILVEANRLTTEALDIDKKMMEEDNKISEIRQMALNLEGEKKLRRSLNAIGIENSPNATNYLQGKIQEAADTLASMKRTNNLTVLKYDNARKGLNNDLRAILNETDSKRALLNANFDDNIFNLDQYVSGARSSALKDLKDQWIKLTEKDDDLMKEAGDKIEEAKLKYLEMDNDKKNNDRLMQNDAWSRLEWAVGTYGKNVPKGILDGIKAQLPEGTDLESVLKGNTLEELRMKKEGTGGGSSFSFLPSELKSGGQVMSFKDYLTKKEAEAGMTLTPEARAKLEVEYKTKSSNQSKFDPNQIILRLEDRTKNLAKNVRENAISTVKNYLNNGMYEQADKYVDGLGTPISATERGDLIQALNARNNILRIKAELEDFGKQGPITGRLKEFDLWDTKQAEINSLINQTTPGLARGIFKEVGVLTDQDIERYRSTIPSGKNTLEQSQVLTQQLLETINMSIENQLAVMRDSGLNIRDIRERFDNLPGSGANDMVPANTIDASYINSLGY